MSNSGSERLPDDLELGDQRTPQDRLLDYLIDGMFDKFRELMRDKTVKLDHKYDKPHFASLLEIACRRPDRGEFVEVLLKNGKLKPYVNTIIPEPIHYAAKTGAYEALKHLVMHKKIDVNAADSRGYTALHYLSEYYQETEDERYSKCIKLLIARNDVDINKPNKKGYTPIHQAAYYDCREMVELILKHRREELDLDTHIASGRNARTFVSQVYSDLCCIFPPIKYSSVGLYENQVLTAFQNRHLEVFSGLLHQVDRDGSALFDPNYFYEKPYYETCLEMACSEIGTHEFIKVLLGAGADPNKVTKTNFMAPIHIAAEVLNYEALAILLERDDVIVNAVDDLGWTALHYLVISVPEFQLSYQGSQHSSSPAKSPDGQEKQKCSNKPTELPDRLEDFINLLYKKITLPLNLQDLIDLASSENNMKAVNILQKVKGKKSLGLKPVSAKDKLFEYLYKKQTEMFINEFPTEVEMDKELVDSKDQSGNTFLQIAVADNLFDIAETLLSSGANPNLLSNKRPPLITAAKQQNLRFIQLFLSRTNIEVDAVDMKGDTALHHAIRLENLECSVALLNGGANIQKKNVLGKTPLCPIALKALLDKSLMKDPKLFPHQETFELIFDYTLITANRSEYIPYRKDVRVLFNCIRGVTIDLDNNAAEKQHGQITEQHKLLNQTGTTKATGKDRTKKLVDELKAETKLLRYISKNYRMYRSLLDHPIIRSFLQFKWDCVKIIFYINLALFVLYFTALNFFIIYNPHPVCGRANTTNDTSEHKNNSLNTTFENNRTATENDVTSQNVGAEVAMAFLILFLVPLSLREVLQVVIAPCRYLWNWENWLDMGIICITWVIIFVEADACTRDTLDVVVILLSCLELVMLIGREPRLSSNIEMLKTVSWNYVGLLLTYLFPIIAFTHCLFIVFRESMLTSNNIPAALWAFCRTVVFMTGEYDAKDLNFGIMPYTSIFVFLLFVFFISIVLLNLLIGLSVNDTKTIQDKSKILSIISRIHVIYEIETMILMWYNGFKKCCPNLECVDKCFKFVILFQNVPHDQKRLTALPNREGIIKDHPSGEDFIVENSILEEALRIKSVTRNSADEDIEALEKSVSEMLTAFKNRCNVIKGNSKKTRESECQNI